MFSAAHCSALGTWRKHVGPRCGVTVYIADREYATIGQLLHKELRMTGLVVSGDASNLWHAVCRTGVLQCLPREKEHAQTQQTGRGMRYERSAIVSGAKISICFSTWQEKLREPHCNPTEESRDRLYTLPICFRLGTNQLPLSSHGDPHIRTALMILAGLITELPREDPYDSHCFSSNVRARLLRRFSVFC